MATAAKALLLREGESRIELRLDRAGPLARLGHRHVIVTSAVHGTADFDVVQPQNAQFSAAFRVDSLQVDNPDDRAAAGEAFANLLDAAAINGTRTNMLSAALLDAARFPEIQLRLQQLVPTAVTPEGGADARSTTGRYVANVVFTVKGVEHALSVPVEVAALPGGGHVARGLWTVTHTQLGLQPYSAAGGLVRVADAIDIRFTLVAKPH